MNVNDILSRGPLIIGNRDETFSQNGKKDFDIDEMPDIRQIGPMKAPPRPRTPATRRSELNSYT